jgi:uncharacterized membrane protein YtjA (UPF0391 family)
MADIFISYSQADREWVKTLANLIEAEGFSVWWDARMLPGDEFGNLVKCELATSRCIIVVWSRHSIESDWVYGEADEGRRARKLLPIAIEQIEPPTAFRRLHTANFARWQRRRNSEEFASLVRALRARIPKPEPVALRMEPVEPATSLPKSPPLSNSIVPRDQIKKRLAAPQTGSPGFLGCSLIFLVIGLIAAALGFTNVAGVSIAIAKILFFIFMVIFVVLLVAGLTVARRVSGD